MASELKNANTDSIQDDILFSVGSTSASSEMDILSHQIKANAKGLIDSGDYASALSVLNQLKQMLPNDSEIDELINLCNK